jgi:cytochrome oxidase assembly protein ShyY1
MSTLGKKRRSWSVCSIPACSRLVLIGLGAWQLQQKAWKEGLIAALDAQLAGAANRLAGHRNSTGSAANTAASPSQRHVR